jgi:hypothetical protein
MHALHACSLLFAAAFGSAACGRTCASRCNVPDLSRLVLSERAPTQLWFSELAFRALMIQTWIRSSCRQPGPTCHGSPSTVSFASCVVLADLWCMEALSVGEKNGKSAIFPGLDPKLLIPSKVHTYTRTALNCPCARLQTCVCSASCTLATAEGASMPSQRYKPCV